MPKYKLPEKRGTTPTAKQAPYVSKELLPLCLPLGTVERHPKNPNTHPEESLRYIGGSVDAFQQVKPIVVNRRNGYVLGGNGLHEAFELAGREWVAVTLVDFDAAKEAAYMIADNEVARFSLVDEALLAEAMSWAGDILNDAAFHGMFDRITSDLRDVAPEAPPSSTKEVDVDSYEMSATCPRCNFEFDPNT